MTVMSAPKCGKVWQGKKKKYSVVRLYWRNKMIQVTDMQDNKFYLKINKSNNKMIQVTDMQDNKFYLKINNVDCIFMPMCLFISNKFLPLPGKIKGSTLHWYVAREYISYNQIKKAIIKFRG